MFIANPVKQLGSTLINAATFNRRPCGGVRRAAAQFKP